MPRIKFAEVLSYSSEDSNHPADNLLNNQTYRKWKVASSDVGKQGYVTLKLEKLTAVRSVDIGNNGCAFVEVLVSRDDEQFEVLLPASSFMSPVESRNKTEISRVRMFGGDKLNKKTMEQKWSRVKVVCTQPFNKQLQHGLAFITLNAPDPPTESNGNSSVTVKGLAVQEKDEDETIKVGALFARRKEAAAASSVPAAGAAGIRAASAAAAAGTPIPGMKRLGEDRGSGPSGKRQSTGASADQKVGGQSKRGSSASPLLSKLPSASSKNNRNNSTSVSSNRKDGSAAVTTPTQTRVNSPAGSSAAKGSNTSKNERNGTNSNGSSKISTNTIATTTSNDITPNSRRTVDVRAPSQSSQPPGGAASRCYAPFNSLLSTITYAMSGYQNPKRSQLRDKMTAMGAKYRADWESDCTHLVCAFTNTPKYQSVRGRGKIVSHRWVEDCHTFKKRMPWRRYRLDKDLPSDESEEEVWAEELRPRVPLLPSAAAKAPGNTDDLSAGSAPQQGGGATKATSQCAELSASEEEEEVDGEGSYGAATDVSSEVDTDDEIQRALGKRPVAASCSRTSPSAGQSSVTTPASVASSIARADDVSDEAYGEDTDEDEKEAGRVDTSKLPLPPLLSCFTGKEFFLHGHPRHEDSLRRYIIAFDGTLSEYMSGSVQYVITDSDWDQEFVEAAQRQPSLQFVRPAWVWQCSDKGKLVPCTPHLVLPQDT